VNTDAILPSRIIDSHEITLNSRMNLECLNKQMSPEAGKCRDKCCFCYQAGIKFYRIDYRMITRSYNDDNDRFVGDLIAVLALVRSRE
jgi:hypothetical protein